MDRLFIQRAIVSTILTVLILFAGWKIMRVLGGREIPVRQMSFKESAKTVQATPVEYLTREIGISAIGRVISEDAIDLAAEVQGEVLPGAVPLQQAQSFGKGQVLFKIDDEEAKLSLYAQKSDFMTSLAGILPDLKIDYPDAYPQWQAYFDALSVEEPLPDLPSINGSQEKVFFSTRNIINQYYTIKSAEERLEKYVVKAPFRGSFIEVLQKPGSAVSPGTRVARIARSNSLELEVPLRTDELAFVSRGTEVKIIDDAKPELYWVGRVRRIGSIVDPATQSVNIYISIRGSSSKPIYEGQYFRVDIPGTRLKDVMEIPRNAVFNRNQVYVVRDSSEIEVQDVRVEKIKEETILFSGLDEGALVVTQPLVNAYPSMPVKVGASKGATSPADLSDVAVDSGKAGGGTPGATRTAAGTN